MRYTVVALTLGLAAACGHRESDSTRRQKQPPEAVFPPNTEASPAPPPSSPTQPADLALPNPGKPGPFKVLSFSGDFKNPAFQSAIIYYPDDTSAKSFPATTLSGGYANTKELMAWLGQHLASHGMIAIVFTPTNILSIDARIWATGHLGALDQLEIENQKAGSPLAGRVDLARLGIMGFSMGGAGTVLAVNQAGSRVKAAVPLCPFQPAVLTAAVPMLSVTGTNDAVAAPAYVESAFRAAQTGKPKAFAKFKGLAHRDLVLGGSHHEDIARYATAFYKLFLEDDSRYQTYISGEELEKQLNAGTVFAQRGDYIYQD